MQATYARKAFPCFDEPAMKAVFNVTIVHDRGTVALSNGKEVGEFNVLWYIFNDAACKIWIDKLT